jgi:cytochrome oxidase Cu insertion factor (SCO1/SenC/PrrC family)
VKRAPRLIAITAAAALGAALVATLAHRQRERDDLRTPAPGPYLGSTPPPGIRLPEFILHNQRGETIATRKLEGRVVVFTFLDSACHDSCPIIASVIATVIRRLTPAERSHVSAFALTVNPSTDAPQNVTRFLRARGANGRLDFLLSTARKLQPLWKEFGVIPATQTGDADIHSADVRIFDRHGIWVTTQRPGVDLTPANLVHDLREALSS